MILMLVDDCRETKDMVAAEVAKLPEVHICQQFDGADKALEYTEAQKVAIAVLGDSAGGMDGAELGRVLRERNPDIILVYVCGEADRAGHVLEVARPDLIDLKKNICLGGGKTVFEKCHGSLLLSGAGRPRPDLWPV